MRKIPRDPRGSLTAVVLAMNLASGSAFALDTTEEDYQLKLLGKYVFFDKISSPQRMACVTCHDPDTGGTGGVSGVNLHQVVITGADPHTKGNLKPPTNAYASFIAPFAPCAFGAPPSGQFCGGNFWNGRAEGLASPLFPDGATEPLREEVLRGITDGAVLGYAKYFGPTSDQALNPMPNPVEQNIDRQAVCEHVRGAKYAELFALAWGLPPDCSTTPTAQTTPETPADISFKRIMLAVGAWQHSAELNSFSSKRDLALRAELACKNGLPEADPFVCINPNYAGSPGTFPLVGLTVQENQGHDLFYNTRPVPFAPAGDGNQPPFPNLPQANCSFCHTDNPSSDTGAELHQLYADDAFHNIGVPSNPELPVAAPDPGVAGHTGRLLLEGSAFFKTPTLRNVDKRKGNGFTKAYAHNGWFKSLESIVHFYNTADVSKPGAGTSRCAAGITKESDALAHNCWPAPEAVGTAIGPLVGNLGMNQAQEAAIVAYLKTLTDTRTPTAPAPYKSPKQ